MWPFDAPNVHSLPLSRSFRSSGCTLASGSFSTWNIYSLADVETAGIMNYPAGGRWGCEGLNGFDFAHRIKGSVPVQAIDHRKRRCNQLSADSNQRDFALAA